MKAKRSFLSERELRGIAQDELLALSVPEREAEQRAYLEKLSVWQHGAACFRDEIEGLENDLNEVVYEVYGVEVEEREVIEGFLARF